MTAKKPERNNSGNEASNRKGSVEGKADRHFTKVNFEELNFEQRRTPYNSSSRTTADENTDRTEAKDNSDRGPEAD